MNLAAKMGAGIYADHLMRAAQRWGILAVEDQARWLAQCSVESGGFKRVAEGMNYRAERLLEVFRGRNGINTLSVAQQIVAGGQQAIANAVYGGTWGAANLGNTQPGDGWKFRGQGLIQTTGRWNFRAASIGMYGDEHILLDNPTILQEPEGAAESAAFFWYDKKLNGITDIRVVTRKINRGMLELDKRIELTQRALSLAHDD